MTQKPDDRQAIQEKAISLGKRRARLGESLDGWTTRAEHVSQMVMLLKEAMEKTREEERRLEEELRKIDQQRLNLGA